MKVRASLGTLALLNIIKVEQAENPTTAYILLHSDKGCMGECAFCPQSRLSRSNKSLVSRVSWPEIDLELLIDRIKECDVLKRICVQSIIKDNSLNDLLRIVTILKEKRVNKPVSISTTPLSKDYLHMLRDLGVDALGIGFDASTPEIFNRVKKPYSWNHYLKFLRESIDVFGPDKVFVHLIYGLGEGDAEFVKSMMFFKSLGVRISLFAFTPVKGTPYEGLGRPNIVSYRKIQILRYLIESGKDINNYYKIQGANVLLNKELIKEIMDNLNNYYDAFITSGCTYCNRPFYNESVRGPYYNYPSKDFLNRNIDGLLNELKELLNERE
ncbi:MAG: radical SAM protein [Sulfolobales archaeon]